MKLDINYPLGIYETSLKQVNRFQSARLYLNAFLSDRVHKQKDGGFNLHRSIGFSLSLSQQNRM